MSKILLIIYILQNSTSTKLNASSDFYRKKSQNLYMVYSENQTENRIEAFMEMMYVEGEHLFKTTKLIIYNTIEALDLHGLLFY